VKLDPHVHTTFSGKTSLYPLRDLLRESYNSPQSVYRLAKERGMDLVAITDHDTIDGALTLAHLEDVIAGCEVTATIPALVRTRYGICELDGPARRLSLRGRACSQACHKCDQANRERLFSSVMVSQQRRCDMFAR